MLLERLRKRPPSCALYYRDAANECTVKFVIDRNTHIGRVPFPKSPCDLPPAFRKAKAALILDERDMAVSRNHALLAHERGAWKIYDLNSRNGTVVNSTRLHAGVPRQLRNNNRISVGQTEFLFQFPMTLQNSALLVGCPGIFSRRLNGIRNDLDDMKDVLGQRGTFDGNMSELYGSKATRNAIIRSLRLSAAMNSDDSLFIFYYCGHGSRAGMSVSGASLQPPQLYEELSNIRGKKLVLLDCCHSLAFIRSAAIPSNTLVIAGESEQGVMFEGEVTCNGDLPLFSKYIQGFLTRAFVKLLEQSKGAIDLKHVATELGQYHALRDHGVGVHAAGVSLMLPRQSPASGPVQANTMV